MEMNERTSDASTGAPIETTPTTTNTNAGPDVEKQEVEHKAGSLNSSSNSAQPLLLKRIAPVLPHLRKKLEESESDAEWATNTDIVGTQIRAEEGNALKYRTCSWQKTAMLLFSEYICLAIMSFPWSYSILGLIPGLLLTLLIAALVYYTSLTLWEFCLRHPEVRDICDIGQMLFWGHKWAWWATAAMFILNNTFIQGLHVLVTAKWLNTVTGHSQCTVVFAAVSAILCFICSLPRTFSGLSKIALASAVCTFISVLLATIFHATQPYPTGASASNPPRMLLFPASGTSFVLGMSAFLNIAYTFIGQIMLPSFIAEMRNPAEFPKALKAVTTAQIVVYSLVGALIYKFTGVQYVTSPAFGSLRNEALKKVAFSFMLPTLVFLGVLYAVVSARFIMFRIFADGNRHKTGHTVLGWAAWAGILALTWLGAFVIAEVIPFFNDLLGLMCSLFDSFFGFIFWGVAWIRMRRVDFSSTIVDSDGQEVRENGPGGWWRWFVRQSLHTQAELVFNLLICGMGCFFLVAGTYSTVESIKVSFRDTFRTGVFSCADTGL